MAEDAIGKAGLYFDELNKIRVLEPETAVQTNDLKDACKDFLESELNLDVTTANRTAIRNRSAKDCCMITVRCRVAFAKGSGKMCNV